MNNKISKKSINISQDLSIFITTMNRYDFIKSLINFYETQKVKVPIYIADSSISSTHQKIKKKISKSDLNIKLLYFNKNVKQVDLFIELVKNIKTKLCIYSGDDDYIILDKLSVELDNQSLSFFENNILNLRAFAWILDKNKIPKTPSPVRSIPFEQENDDERLIDFAFDYNSIMFSVVCKNSFLDALYFSSNFKTKEMNAEVAICYKLAFGHKVILTKEHCLIRLAHESIINLSDVGDSQKARQVDRFSSLIDLLGFEKIKKLPMELIQPERDFLYDLDLVIDNSPSFENLVKSSDWVFEYFSKNFLFKNKNIKNLDVLFWGNKQTLRISSSWIFSKFKSQNVLVFFTFEDCEDDKKYLKDKFKNKNIFFYEIPEVASLNEAVLLSLFKKLFEKISIGTFLSISALYSTEKILIKFLNPNQTVLVWPHASNLLNYPFILSLSKYKFFKGTFIRFVSYLIDYRGVMKSFIFKFLKLANNGFYLKNVFNILTSPPKLNLKTIIAQRLKIKMVLQIFYPLLKRFKIFYPIFYPIFFILGYVIYFPRVLFKISIKLAFSILQKFKLILNLPSIIKIFLIKIIKNILDNKSLFQKKIIKVPIFFGIAFRIYNSLLRLVAKKDLTVLKKHNKNNYEGFLTISKINYPKSSVANQLWIYNNMIGKVEHFFFSIFPYLFRDYFGYFLLPQILNVKISYISGSDKFTQIGGELNDKIFCLSKNEGIVTSKFSKSKFIKHEKIYKSGPIKKSKKSKKIALMTLSVGLISENAKNLSLCLEEVIELSKELGINEIHVRPHYRETYYNNNRLIEEGNKFKKVNFKLASNKTPFYEEVQNYSVHFSSISGSIFESDAYNIKVILLKNFSKQQYKGINQFLTIYPQFTIK